MWFSHNNSADVVDNWQIKMRALRKHFKGWNINVEGMNKRMRKVLILQIDHIDKEAELMGLNVDERRIKLQLEQKLANIMKE